MLVRAGAFIPMVADMSSTTGYNTKHLTLHYYADTSVKASSSVMYNDDGKDPNSLANGDYETLTFAAAHNGEKLSFDIARKGRFKGMPVTRQLSLVIHNVENASRQIKVNNKLVPLVEHRTQLNNRSFSAWYDNKHNKLLINTPWRKLVNIELD